MRRSLLVAVVSLGISLVPAALLAAGNPNSCGTDVKNLAVEIFSRTSEPAYNIVGDGEGIVPKINTYTNINTKGNKITLLFQISNCSYDFTMNLSQSSRDIKVFLPPVPIGDTTAWFFNFDRIGSVPVLDDAGDLLSPWCTPPVYNTPIIVVNGMPLDNYGGCFEEPIDSNFPAGPKRYFARRRAAFDLVNGYSLHFQSSPFEAPYLEALTSGTSYIKVYHPSLNEWTLEPEAPAPVANSVLLQQANSGPPLFVSYQTMPFKMVITRGP